MLVCGAANLFQEISQIGLLGKPGQLRSVIKPHIQQPFNTVRLQCFEELAGAFLGKTDAVDLHWSSSSSANKAGCSFTRLFPDSLATSSSAVTRPSPRMCKTSCPRSM